MEDRELSEYWLGFEEHKAGRLRPDKSRPFAQKGWDDWSDYVAGKLDPGWLEQIERHRPRLPVSDLKGNSDADQSSSRKSEN